MPQQKSGEAAEALSNELKALANQGVFLTDEDIEVQTQQPQEQQGTDDEAQPTTTGPLSPAANTRGAKSGPPSPASAGIVGGRKRRSRDDLATSMDEANTSDLGEASMNRKNSLRGGTVKGARAKRQKLAATN